MAILYLIDSLTNSGGTFAMFELIDALLKKGIITDFIICTNEDKNHSNTFKDKRIVTTPDEFLAYANNGNYELIHRFSTGKSKFFDEIITMAIQTGRTLKNLITTHCQLPVKKDFRLSFNELKYSRHLVFITNEAYNHKYHKFIDDVDKTLIYFGVKAIDEVVPTQKKSGNKFILGRGSTLNKCPVDVIKNFKKICTDNMELHIAGKGPQEGLLQAIKDYDLENKVIIHGLLSYERWMDLIKSFDIFWYQLPLDSYSAIDATIQHAMLNEIPVVLLGPPSPAELIVNGETGFVAKDESDFLEKTQLLIDDATLRKEMGKKSRKRLIEVFSHHTTVKKYEDLYNKISMELDNRQFERKVPLRMQFHLNYFHILIDAVKLFFRKVKEKIIYERNKY